MTRKELAWEWDRDGRKAEKKTLIDVNLKMIHG